MAAIKVEWTHITILSVIAFVAGWFIFGLFGAIVLAIIVMVLMGIIKIVSGYSMTDRKKEVKPEEMGEFISGGIKQG